MIRAATYARYSSDKQREASIEDQERNCRAFAAREGWTMIARFSDAAISGATRARPGYARMLEAAEQGAFDALIVDDLSRLSRDDIEMKQVIRRFRYRGVRIVGVSDGFDTESKGYKVHAGVRGLLNELYLDDLRDKTHRGLTGQALKGNNTGGRAYGYHHVPVEHPTDCDTFGRPVVTAVRRKIDPEQARWVREIFGWYADGRSPRWIAAELNRLAVPSPRGGAWAQSAIYGDMKKGTGLLNNELYIGRFVWNRSRWVKDPDTGMPRRVERPEQEWIKSELLELRIVAHDLWAQVKARQASQRERSVHVREALHRNARSGAGPKYLFSGLLKCAVCGGSYIIADRSHYRCGTYINRGPAACGNSLRASRRLIEERLVETLKRDLFTPEALKIFQKEAVRAIAEAQRGTSETSKVVRNRLAQVEREIANLIAAIKAGIVTPTTKNELQKAEAEHEDLRQRASALSPQKLDLESVFARAHERYREIVSNLSSEAIEDIPAARRCVGALFGGEIKLFPMPEGYLEAEFRGDYAGLIRLASDRPPGAAGRVAMIQACQLSLVAGEGFEPPTKGL